jgi:DNA-binding FadR family transcriptional regulator
MANLAASRMSTEQVDILGSSIEVMRENLTDREVFLQENKRFHAVIAHGSGNAMFGCLIDVRRNSNVPTPEPWPLNKPASDWKPFRRGTLRRRRDVRR